MARAHYNVTELVEEFEWCIWFKKPGDRDIDPRGLKAFVTKVSLKHGRPIGFDTPIRVFDKHMKEYEQLMSQAVSFILTKDANMRQTMLAQLEQATSDGTALKLWVKDPFCADDTLDDEREALSEEIKKQHTWLCNFTQDMIRYNCKYVFDPALVAVVTKWLRSMRASETPFLWAQVKALVRQRMSDMTPITLMESQITMTRPPGMSAEIYANAFLSIDGLVKASGIKLGKKAVSYYFRGQFTTQEMVAVEFEIPVTEEEKDNFNI